MSTTQQPEALAFCWATELAMTQQPVTLSVTEAREVSAEMQRLHAENETLRAAAQAVIDRWETPLWKDVEPTAAVIGRLRAAVASEQTSAWGES